MYRISFCVDQVFSRTIIGLVVCQLSVLGMFSLRGGHLRAVLLLPLPCLSAYFYLRCQQEFEAVTERLPVEVCSCLMSSRDDDFGTPFVTWTFAK